MIREVQLFASQQSFVPPGIRAHAPIHEPIAILNTFGTPAVTTQRNLRPVGRSIRATMVGPGQPPEASPQGAQKASPLEVRMRVRQLLPAMDLSKTQKEVVKMVEAVGIDHDRRRSRSRAQTQPSLALRSFARSLVRSFARSFFRTLASHWAPTASRWSRRRSTCFSWIGLRSRTTVGLARRAGPTRVR